MADDDAGQYAFLDDDSSQIAEQVEKVCKVYDAEDFFTVFVQLLLAFLALMSLWFKRQSERPKRKFKTWFLDVSKQGLGACYAHVLNMIIAAIIVDKGGDGSLNDQCAWYGMAYLVDTTLGLLLAIWGLKAIDWLANEYDWASLKHSGVYVGVDGILHWIHQAVAWLFILTVSKVIIYFFMLWTSDALAYVGGILFKPLQGNIRFELLFVMIFFPGLLNVIYFWVADHFLKAGAEHAGAHEEETLDTELAQKSEGLLNEEGDKGQVDGPQIWVNNDGSEEREKSARIINVI
mmetsp:Transcript_32027/g.53577  ORF Transcript_32027/g.53577 Transcript_32027/m.53577 type:complete len:291 (+) Transcript_32027:203-1075(+)|eukprot:CAMPEP_0178759122 /NCGR_PEP_ID=MMETSP0744-20121128/14764_1 /TAXON_ID=913974 /ORGANISM="Nitzschia punctata, Strain CCMP561" /LENGTH=290 /DNA_ID=CAMNT_0020413559 /DNA_START=126 /DNA_END=998 /DNA_ORIENTATION=+